MTYPSLEQYNNALQAPNLHFLDSELRSGVVRKSGLGMPLALCGGFALTYTIDVGGKRYAVRCFHKHAADLERRYQVISAKLRQLKSPWFLPFEFNPRGIRIHGKEYPIVKMEWAAGETLSEFLEREYGNSHSLNRLRATLARLSEFLEKEGIAHGDLQPGNIMVSQNGGAVQLIDYDGMYVEAFRGAHATELGQINFQHPQRSATNFNAKIDRFSFIALDVALQALAADPGIWKRSHSDPDAVVFRRSDYLTPAASPVFKDVLAIPSLAEHVKHLAQVASAPMEQGPSLADFLQLRGIPQIPISFLGTRQVGRASYQGAYPVLDATNYEAVLRKVGDRIELIGRIDSVVKRWTVNRKPYVFVNFSDWRGNAVKLCIWSQGLTALGKDVPDESWEGKWITVSGLVDTPYPGKSKSGASYTHVSMTVSQRGQMQVVDEMEAKYRLGVGVQAVNRSSQNSEIVRSMGGARPSTKTLGHLTPTPVVQQTVAPKSNNQQVIERMQAALQPAVLQPKPTPSLPASSPSAARPQVSVLPKVTSNEKKQPARVGRWILLGVVVMLFFIFGRR